MNALSLQNFEFEGQGVRSLMQDDEPWFVLSDICRVLEITNVGNAAARLDEDEKNSIRNMDVNISRGNPNITIVNESGLYSLILTSRKEAAKRFKKWVTSEVLPALRRTGVYIMDGRDDALPSIIDTKVFGMQVAKVNAAARLISVANAIYGPEAARALWESELALPKVAHKTIYGLTTIADDDPAGCFKHILRFSCGDGKRVGDVIRLALHDAATAQTLHQYGLVTDPHQHKGNLAIASIHPFLNEVFAQTQWAGGWQVALMQLDGAKAARLRFGTGSKVLPFVLIPRRTVLAYLTAIH